ncbi:beta-ketoacyl-ACP synthase [Bermanella marisrubri]|uniref:Putative 3-oxoacyl-[acyl-carrier-protein] synthase synthase n=1 Tax=Bermanella marisrubri TaxID=207949 RepID=Q1N369_9GAMM|nr:beta-ketoacyl-[acyl-carrier-protein] synthase family protein [Bermanella marisrubri]EAT12722.1 putative 3-oxoacyl-[acyl-carrier-protein] synthase synthase [Oceanobacter sp. RED65] [Bermanella marisrubri]QIZ85159.1 beta-ketoacyl-ACP synthase [Bermanella marisrubri]
MSVTRKRVVITGLGVLSSIGKSIPEFKQGLLDKQVGIKPSEAYREYFEGAYASEILGELDYPGLDPELTHKLDKGALWGYRVGREALLDSDLLESDLKKKMGLMVGVSAAGTEAYLPFIMGKPEETNLDMVKYSGSYASICPLVSSLLEIGGGYELVATACTASPNAIGLAYDAIQNNKGNVMLALGSEPLYIPTFAGFYALKAMASGPCNPYSDQPGMSVGEGAGAIVLEEYEHAKARGAKIYGELLGYSTTSDAYHETAPDPKAEGSSLVMNTALRNTGLTAEDIDYVNAHGTGTEANDRSETLAIKKVFGEGSTPPISSTKSYFGHNIGAAGILELIACLLTLPEKKVLPTLNFGEARSYADLDYIPNDFRDMDVNVFMKNNYAFGGNNSCLVTSTKPGTIKTAEFDEQRVVITGMGSVSSLGLGNSEFTKGLMEGGATPQLQELKVELDEKDLGDLPVDEDGLIRYYCHKVESFNPRKILRSVDVRKLNNITLYAMVAMEQALKNAGYKVPKSAREEVGMIMGISKGPTSTISRLCESLSPDPNNVRTSEFAMSLMNSIATQCAISKGVKGYNTTLSSGVNAGLGSLIQGYEVIRQNLQDFMLAGASDEESHGFSPLMMLGNEDINYGKDSGSYKPYSERDSGYIMGEGASCLFMESLSAAKNRGAKVYAEVLGYGRASEYVYFHEEQSDGHAMADAITQALQEAQLSASDLDVIYGSAWSGKRTIQSELLGIKTALGESASEIPLTNVNSYFGFIEASGGLLTLTSAIHGAQDNLIFPIKNTESFALDGLNFVKDEILEKPLQHLLITGQSEGGNCYAIVLKKGEPS